MTSVFLISVDTRTPYAVCPAILLLAATSVWFAVSERREYLSSTSGLSGAAHYQFRPPLPGGFQPNVFFFLLL
jgi:hypothetical protein